MSHEPTQPQPTRRPISRRTMVGAAAWSVPVITVVTAAPAFAVYSAGPKLSIGAVTLSRTSYVAGTPEYGWVLGAYTGPDTNAAPADANAVLVIQVTNVKATGGIGADTVTLQLAIPDQGAGPRGGVVQGAAGQYGAVPSGWALSGTPTRATTGTVTFAFTTTSTLTAGGTAPPFTFATVFASGAAFVDTRLTTPVSGKVVTATATAPRATSGTMMGTLA